MLLQQQIEAGMSFVPVYLFSHLSVTDAAYEVVLADLHARRAEVERRIVTIEREREMLRTPEPKD
jgi:hypothetical protein